VAGAEEAWSAAFSALRASHHMPPEPRTQEGVERLQRRIAHLLVTDPGGSWVAADSDEVVVGLAQALVRGDLWVLSLLGVSPQHQDRHTGKALLEAATSYGAGSRCGMILCSRDPRAARRYSRAGFDLHPSVVARGRVSRRALPRLTGVRPGGADDLGLVADLDRRLRGGPHGPDLIHSLEGGCRLLVAPGRGYVVARGPRPWFLAAVDEDVASGLLLAALATAGTDEEVTVEWITARQQWAIRACLDVGLELHPAGPVMTRGFDPPPAYLPSGAFG